MGTSSRPASRLTLISTDDSRFLADFAIFAGFMSDPVPSHLGPIADIAGSVSPGLPRPVRSDTLYGLSLIPAAEPTRMSRLLEIPTDRLTAGRGRILGPYKIWIHSPKVASGMEEIGTFLNKRSSLTKREVEIGILVISQHWQADYVRQAHIREGKAAGLSPE